MQEKVRAVNYICPNCGGRMQWNISSQRFCCIACKTEMERGEDLPPVEEHDLKEYAARLEEEPALEENSMTCQTCGSNILFEPHETAKVCPMCGSAQIFAEKQASGIGLDGVIPFAVDEADAQANFRKWVKTRWFAPNKLKQAYQEGNLQGMYIPFWTFDIEAMGEYVGRGGEEYEVEKSDGETETKVSWTRVSGTVENTYDDIPVCASKGEQAAIIDKILPFSTGQAVPYETAYLSGFLAEHYVVPVNEACKTAREEVERDLRNKAEDQIRGRGYDRAEVNQLDTEYMGQYYKQVLLPVWASNFYYNKKHYMYMINGETGLVGGTRPYSKLKIALAILVAALIIIGIVVFVNTDSSAAAVQVGNIVTDHLHTGSACKIWDAVDGTNISAEYYGKGEGYYGMVWTR